MEAVVAKHAAKKALETDEGDEGCNCECNQKTWPNILCGMGMGGGAFAIVTSILNLVGSIPPPNKIMLEIYCSGFGLLCIMAEARRFKLFRGLVYRIIKHVYFITTYTGRAAFYFFLGTIMFDTDSLLSIVCSIYLWVLSAVLIIINLIYKLPQYLDPQEKKRMEEERMRREVEERYLAERQAAEQAAQGMSASVQHTAHSVQRATHDAFDEARMPVERNTVSPPPRTSSGGGPNDDPFASGGGGGGYSPPALR